jgi:DNA polymerase-1
MKKLILIDGSNVMFRAYFGTAYSGNLMQNSKGQYTNAVFGFVNMMNSVLAEDFTHILVAFDKSGKTFRHEDFPDYKGGRPPMPEEFRSQIDLIKQSLDVLGVKQREIELIEADDIIGTYATKYYDDFDDIEIISNDKDLLQLVNDKVHQRVSKKGMQDYVDFTPEHLEETLGIPASLIPDMKGLMGDSSDNLPGIPGVGEKTAVKLLKEYGSLEGVIAHKDEIKGKLGERVREHYETARLCKRLATIKTDVPFHFSLEEVAYEGVDVERMIPFYQELELHSLIKKFNRRQKKPAAEFAYTPITDIIDVKTALRPNSSVVLEYFGTNYHAATPLGFGIANEDGAYFIPYDLLDQSMDLQLFLQDESVPKSVFDLKAMRVILNQRGYDLAGVTFDLLLAAYLLNPNNTKEDVRVIVSNFDYDDVAYYEEVYGKGRNYGIPSPEVFQRYAVKKAVAVMELKDRLVEELKDNDQYELFANIELPLAGVLAKMEYTGIRVDADALRAQGDALDERIEVLTRDIHELAGEEFNIQSPKQLGEILFESLGLPGGKKTKTGYSTAAGVLEKLIDDHPIIEKILTYRMLTKLKSTYVEGLAQTIHEDGKIHTIYRQAFTSTGRLSSVEPNLQNIPIRYEEGRAIRKVFVPEKGHRFLACDYSQIELRVLAHMAQEQALIEAFQSGQDIHTRTAQLVFGTENVTPQERRQAKAVNFGILYGQSAWGLSEGIHINQYDAKRFIERYYERFPGIKQFMENVVKTATDQGYVETIYHRRRYIPELQSSVYMQREAGKRNAMNAPIQGSAADIIKIAMIEIDRAMTKHRMKSKLLLQIHDELVFDVHPDELDQMESLVKQTMEHCVSLDVPLTVEGSFGDNLYDTK